MIATCPHCHNTGAIGERYCTCEAAQALRARIDNDPRMQELRAKIDRALGSVAERTVFVRAGAVAVVHPLGPVETPVETAPRDTPEESAN